MTGINDNNESKIAKRTETRMNRLHLIGTVEV